jgi:hypothetical protein
MSLLDVCHEKNFCSETKLCATADVMVHDHVRRTPNPTSVSSSTRTAMRGSNQIRNSRIANIGNYLLPIADLFCQSVNT